MSILSGTSGTQDAADRSDSALMTLVRSGDETAFGALYDRHAHIVYAVALRVLGNTGSAEDVLQDVFMQLWRKPGAFDASRGNLAAWLAVIARHRSIDLLRRRRPETDIEEVIVSDGLDLGRAAEASVLAGKARKLMEHLSREQSQALEMAFFQGMTHSEIAAKTGEPLGTIKTRIRAAVAAIRKRLKV